MIDLCQLVFKRLSPPPETWLLSALPPLFSFSRRILSSSSSSSFSLAKTSRRRFLIRRKMYIMISRVTMMPMKTEACCKLISGLSETGLFRYIIHTLNHYRWWSKVYLQVVSHQVMLSFASLGLWSALTLRLEPTIQFVFLLNAPFLELCVDGFW